MVVLPGPSSSASSSSAPLSAREQTELADYFRDVASIAHDVGEEQKKAAASRGSFDTMYKKPPESVIPPADEEDYGGRIADEKVIKIFHSINEMSVAELKKELREVHLAPHGTRRQLRDRLKSFYRKAFSQLQAHRDRARACRRTAERYKYLVAIDVEATCESEINDINYQHEVIELPAVLIETSTLSIIDKFRTFVKPEINPILSAFCTRLTGIEQEAVDTAPTFPEAFEYLLMWMERHGMMGSNKTATFAIVTDGPNDIQHFLQRSFLQYNMRIPHDFRHFINIKQVFRDNVPKAPTAEQRKQEKKTAIKMMLEHLQLEQYGSEHSGIDDAVNIARITIAMLIGRRRAVELQVNQRIVRVKSRPLCLPPPLPIEMCIVNADEDNDRRKGQRATDRLPYRTVMVRREDFHSESYWDCDTCDEEEA